jgi:hypothetical protein
MRRLESYRSGLADIVGGITTLYAASDRLPVVAARTTSSRCSTSRTCI